MYNIILSGIRQSGKTTVSELLMKHEHRLKPFTFADNMKMMLSQFLNIDVSFFNCQDIKEEWIPIYKNLDFDAIQTKLIEIGVFPSVEVSNHLLSKWSKCYKLTDNNNIILINPRYMMWYVGDEFFKFYDKGVWAKGLHKHKQLDYNLITDCKYHVEFDACKQELDNINIIHIVTGKESDKKDNHELHNFDDYDNVYTIYNNQSLNDLNDLEQMVISILNEIRGKYESN